MTMGNRTYPVPAGIGGGSMTGDAILAAVTRDDEVGAWAAGVVQREMDALGVELGRRYYGVLDPSTPEALVAAVIRTGGDGGIERHDGSSGWDPVPPEMEPVGLECAVLDDPGDVMAAVTAAAHGGWLLRAATPKCRMASAVTAAAGATGSLFAIVDDFDTTAVLELIQVEPGPKVSRRENGEWVPDGAILGQLNSVDPPQVVPVGPDIADQIISQVDSYDGEAAGDDATVASADCPDCDDDLDVGVLAASPPATTRMPSKLKNYWARGEGAAKIRWGVGGDFNRCRRQLAKYLRPDQVSGACANLHKIATGTWPGRKTKH